MVKVSVVVACFNSEKTLRRCIDSILKQTLKDIEIILVDDGSTDNTRDIILEYEHSNHRIRSHCYNENRGAGYAKNSGISIANGDFIGFVDSDDYVDSDYYLRMYWSAIAFNADVVAANIMIHDGDSEQPHNLFENNLYLPDFVSKPLSTCLIEREVVVGHWSAASACTKLFCRKLVERYSFFEGICDDLPFVIPAIASSERIAYCPDLYYHYIHDYQSLERSDFTEKRLGIADSFILTVNRLNDIPNSKELIKIFFVTCICSTLVDMPQDASIISKFRQRFDGAICNYFFDIDNNKYLFRHLNLLRETSHYLYALIRLFSLNKLDALEIHISQWGTKRKKYKPKVSIIIPVYNGSNYLAQAIESALAQTYPNIEVIVVNDGSNDDNKTEDIALRYADKIRYIHKANGGVATALNRGIEEMEGEYFSWLSHDDLYTCDKIAKQMDMLDKLDDITTVVYNGYDVINETGEILYSVCPANTYSEDQLNTPLFAVFRGLLNGCCLLIHRSHFARVGSFDAKLRTTQDYDLWFRILRSGNIKYVNHQLILSRVHPEQDSTRLRDFADDESTQLWVCMALALTNEERCVIDGSVKSFWENTEFFLRVSTPFKQAADLILEQMKNLTNLEGLSAGSTSYFYLNNSELSMQLAKCRISVSNLENIIHAFENSTSWRVTKPLRKVKQLLAKRD